MILTVRCTVDDVDSTSRFCVRMIQIVDVRWPKMSDSRQQQYQTISDITCYVSVGPPYGKSNVSEIQHLRRLIYFHFFFILRCVTLRSSHKVAVFHILSSLTNYQFPRAN